MNDTLARAIRLTLVEKAEVTSPAPSAIVPELLSTSTNPPPGWFPVSKDTSRWLSSLGIVLAVHSAPIVWWLIPDNIAAAHTPPPAAMVVELAPAPVAPASKPDMPTPGPEEAEVTPLPKPQPEPEPELPPLPEAKKPEVAIKPRPEAKPEPKTTEEIPEAEEEDAQQPESIASAPPEATQENAKAAAPNQGAPTQTPQSNHIPTWQNSLMLKLNEAKRYPARARRSRQEGVSYLRFTMDREGKVLARSIERSAGSPLLDQETLELIERAQPLPKPPAEIQGETLEFVVPVEFFLNR